MDFERTVVARAVCALLAFGCSSGTHAGDSANGGMSGTSAGGGGTVGSGGASNGTSGGSSTGGNSGRAGSGGSLPGSGGSGGSVPARSPFDWVGVIGAGQSLSVGWDAPAINTTASHHNLKLRDDGADPKYPIQDSPTAVWSAVPLLEPIRTAAPGTGPGYDDGQYPNNIWRSGDTYGESPHTALANAISTACEARGDACITVHTVVGHGALNDQKKGTRQYQGAVNEARVWKKLAEAAGKSYGVGAIVLTHGETDAFNPDYGTGVYQWLQDFNVDLKAITGQSEKVVLLASQQSSTPAGWGSVPGSAVQIWRAGVDHPGEIVVTGPKYQFGAYGLHLSAAGYERMGEKYGEVFDRIVNRKAAWKPLEPKQVTRSGAVLTIAFDVPNPPLIWDDNLAKPHQVAHTAWAKGRGFEVMDSANNEIEIASVQIVDQSVVVTLATAPSSGTTLRVGYALTQDTSDAYQGGTDLGPHGQLADSDDFPGQPETLDINVTGGSTAISGVSNHRTKFDLVSGDELPQGTILLNAAWGSGMLSQAWAGATGKAQLKFQHNHRNYCVHFQMAVP